MTMHVCYYHAADLDGHCSGAIFARAMGKMNLEYKLIPYNYNDEIDLDDIKDREVYFIDCAPQPLQVWLQFILAHAKKLYILDHHKTLIENPLYQSALQSGQIGGRAIMGVAGCYLAWEHWRDLLGSMPATVKLLSLYDTWSNEDKKLWDDEILPFQYGMRLHVTNPVSSHAKDIWDRCFDDPLFTDEIVVAGHYILKYDQARFKRLARSCSFEANFHGKRVLCLNSSDKSSLTLESVYDPVKHDLMVVYNQVPTKDHLNILISFYTTRDDVDCSSLARLYGGGGHKTAAGAKVKSIDWRDDELTITT